MSSLSSFSFLSSFPSLPFLPLRPSFLLFHSSIIQSNPIQSNPIQSYSIQLNPTQSNSIQLNPIQSNLFLAFSTLIIHQSFSSFGEFLKGDKDLFLPLRRLFFGLFLTVFGVGGGSTNRPDPPGDSRLVRTDGGRCSRNLSDASWSMVI